MKNSYILNLSVSDLSGNRIVAKITPTPSKRIIRISYLKEVELDNPKFAEDGVIKFSVTRDKYSEAIEKLTSYLENLFLKRLSNEGTNTSIRVNSVKRRNAEKDTARKVSSDKRKGDSSSVHISSRGDIQT